MPEVKTLKYSLKEVSEMLVKQTEIHEGHWGLIFQFGLAAANVTTGPDESMSPAAIVTVLGMALQRFDQPNSMTVDAAKINPNTEID